MPVSIGVVIAAVAAKAEAHRSDVAAAELAHQTAERVVQEANQAAAKADLKADHSARAAAIAEAEAVAVLAGRIVHDPAANKVYRVEGGKIVAVTPDSPEVEVAVPPVDIDGDGEPDNAAPEGDDDGSGDDAGE